MERNRKSRPVPLPRVTVWAGLILSVLMIVVACIGLTGCKVHHHRGCWSSGTCYVKPVVENP